MRSKRSENGSDQLKSDQGAKKVQKLKEKNLEEIANRIEESEAAADSSEDSPFVSDLEDSDDEVKSDSIPVSYLVYLELLCFHCLVALNRTLSSHASYSFSINGESFVEYLVCTRDNPLGILISARGFNF